MTKLKALIPVFLAGVLSLGLAPGLVSGPSPIPNPAALNVHPTTLMEQTVIVHITDPNPYFSGHGSGVFVAPHLVATAKHVTEALDEREDRRLIVETYRGERLKVLSILEHEKADVALIHVEPAVLHTAVADLHDLPPVEGSAVYHVGAPWHAGRNTGGAWSFLNGIIARSYRQYDYFGELAMFQHNIGTAPGSSGGPIFDANGLLVGVHVGHYAGITASLRSRLQIAEPAWKIRALIDRFNDKAKELKLDGPPVQPASPSSTD